MLIIYLVTSCNYIRIPYIINMNYYINIFEDEEKALSQVSPLIHVKDHDALEEIEDYNISNGLTVFRYIHTIKFNDKDYIELINLLDFN